MHPHTSRPGTELGRASRPYGLATSPTSRSPLPPPSRSCVLLFLFLPLLLLLFLLLLYFFPIIIIFVSLACRAFYTTFLPVFFDFLSTSLESSLRVPPPIPLPSPHTYHNSHTSLPHLLHVFNHKTYSAAACSQTARDASTPPFVVSVTCFPLFSFFPFSLPRTRGRIPNRQHR